MTSTCSNAATRTDVMAKQDVCLGFYYKKARYWRCVHTRGERLARPVWTSGSPFTQV